MISVNALSEIWIIDHSTSTEEAAGHTGGTYGRGGDLLYRWGNPAAYRGGTAEDQKLFGQHNASWIREGLPGEGNIIIFNNGLGRLDGRYSTIEEIAPPVDAFGNYALTPGHAYGPTNSVWQYVAEPPASFFSPIVSGVQRLPNGNTAICQGIDGIFFEVDTDGNLLWKYNAPVTATGLLTQGSTLPPYNLTFRAPQYPPDYSGFDGRDLTPHGTIELYPAAPFELTHITKETDNFRIFWNSDANTTYDIFYRASFSGVDWTPVGSISAIGTSSYFIDTDPVRVGSASGFYRVQRNP
jgi:hypothetical protein